MRLLHHVLVLAFLCVFPSLIFSAWDDVDGKGDVRGQTPSYRKDEQMYAVVCITNETKERIKYSYRWGDSDWDDQSASPRSEFALFRSCDTRNCSDAHELQVNFVVNDDDNVIRDKRTLEPHISSSPKCRSGHEYSFNWVGDDPVMLGLFDHDGDNHAVICVRNKTGKEVEYRYKWEDARSWTRDTLRPGGEEVYEQRCSRGTCPSSTVTIKYPVDRYNDREKYVYAKLATATRNPKCGDGVQYVFRGRDRDKDEVILSN